MAFVAYMVNKKKQMISKKMIILLCETRIVRHICPSLFCVAMCTVCNVENQRSDVLPGIWRCRICRVV